jgi:DnaK suppressor protein
MDALQGQEMAKAVGVHRQARIKRIDAALRRISEGEYGACLKCGEGIAPRRLAIDSVMECCIACAS